MPPLHASAAPSGSSVLAVPPPQPQQQPASSSPPKPSRPSRTAMAAAAAAAAGAGAAPAGDAASLMIAYQRKQARAAANADGSSAPRPPGGGRVRQREREQEAVESARERSATRPATGRDGALRAIVRPSGGGGGAVRLFDPEKDDIPRASDDEARARERRDRDRAQLEEKQKRQELRVRVLETPKKDRAASRKACRRGGGGDDDGGAYMPRESDSQHSGSRSGAGGPGQLFDPRRDDPVRFAALAKRTPAGVKPGMSSTHGSTTSAGGSMASNSEARSAASTAPPPSVTSSEASRERRRRRGAAQSDTSDADADARRPQSDTNSYVLDLKRTYREITTLETKLKEEHQADEREQRAAGRRPDGGSLDHEFWLRLTSQHRQLAETHASFMEMALRPGLPSSLHSLPQQYSIPTRLWSTGFHLMLERLRHALPSAHAAAATHAALLDHLTEFIYFAYAFYSNLLEAETFRAFRGAWIENLGDLARYRMAVAGLAASRSSTEPRPQVTFARIDDDIDDDGKARPDARAEQASIGTAALNDWELSEVETWRVTARDWYAKGLAETPGTGRLHHHLGVLARPDELRTLYHLCKSLTSAHAHVATRESLLPIFDGAHQRRRVQPDASAADLFVHLHGMLITRVQLDDWDAAFERFTEALRASIAGRSPAFWMQLAAVNVAALLQYGAEDALLAPPENKAAQQDKASSGGSPPAEAAKALPGEGDQEPPLVLQHAIRLTFAILDVALALDAAPNAYITMLLTFLSTTLKQPHSLRLLERAIPWAALVALAARAPEAVDPRCEIASKISTDVPLPEDWCLRGMAWVGRRVYERGFWKPRGARAALCFESEVDVLSRDFEDDDEAEPSLATLRWRRAGYALTVLAKTVPGLDFDADAAGGRGALVLVEPLSSKCSAWLAEELEAREASKRAQLQALPAATPGEEDDEDDSLSEEEPEDADDLPEIAELKAKRRQLKAILRAARAHTRSPATVRGKSSAPARRAPVPLLPGYTILVLDTNIVLTAGSVLEQLVDSARWTVVVPLCVVTELDGLKRNATPLGADAARAIEYLEARLSTHAKCLKIQTSRGNYLPDLGFRTEEIDFGAPAEAARSLDEIILRAVEWQEAHFVDRRALLAAPTAGDEAAAADRARAVLVTLDRNLRLKARARGCHTIGHAELLPILAPG